MSVSRPMLLANQTADADVLAGRRRPRKLIGCIECSCPTLYVTLPDSYLRLDDDTLRVVDA